MEQTAYFLFDLDGTLTDTGPGITGCVQHTLTQLGWPSQTEDFLRQFVGPPLEESFMGFCGLDRAGAERAIQIYRERYNAWGVYQSPLYPGVEGLLERLSARAVLAVATSKREQGARKILGMRGIEGRFAVVVGDDGTRPTKSHVIAAALRLLGEPSREQVYMVGDRRYDMEGAKACGIRSIGVEYGYAPAGELQAAGPEYTVRTVGELEALCASLAYSPVSPYFSAR